MSITSTTSKSRSAPLLGQHQRGDPEGCSSQLQRSEGHAFAFSHCVEVLHQVPKFNPMVDDVDRSSDVAVEVVDGDKKPAA
jgi:hypothetical protein